ncbi:Imm1 family immunity protein [Streptomyces pilosus]|uniref:Imm1 family immunity protein n=1 Tax=Streptomyces pilosus TaxID=28893 RepID=UPI003644F743
MVNVIVYGRGKYAQTEEGVRDLIDDVMTNLEQRVVDSSGYETVPECASFCIVEGKYPEETDKRHADNCLYVSVNTRDSYGALRWWSTQAPTDEAEADVCQFVWTSVSSNPPSFDPLLVKDPGSGECYPRGAAIPIAQLREAVEEFCRNRTGKRPQCIEWQLLD